MEQRKKLWYGGIAALTMGVGILVFTFAPMAYSESKYEIHALRTTPQDAESGAQVTEPKDKEFGIMIPKIGVNALIHKDVDWQDSGAYQKALQTGGAHAAGTRVPNQPGNMFLFAHSGLDWFQAVRYNAEFFLLRKLEVGDTMTVYYQGVPFDYAVTGSDIVEPSAVNQLTDEDTSKNTLTLMTCWPPGTTAQRLLVHAAQTRK